MQYQRPDMSLIESEFRKLLAELDSASFATAQAETLRAINEIRYEFRTMASLSSAITTKDSTLPREIRYQRATLIGFWQTAAACTANFPRKRMSFSAS